MAQAAGPCDGIALSHDDWMSDMAATDMAATIAQRPLTQLVWPGAHDAGTCKYRDLGEQDHVFDTFAATQKTTIGTQLRHGIRYFDLRFRPDRVEEPTTDFNDGQTSGIYIWHGVASTTSYKFKTIVDEIKDFVDEPGHSREILFLDIQLRQPASRTDATTPFFEEACGWFAEELGDLLIDPATVITAFGDDARSWIDATTVGDVWGDPDGRRIIARFTGAGRNHCPSSISSLINWDDWIPDSWYANQCFSEAYTPALATNNPISGITSAAQAALSGRNGSVESTKPAILFGVGSFPTTLGAQAQDFYNLQIQPTQSVGCPNSGPEELAGANDNVLNAVLSWYDANQNNARKFLNILTSDFVEDTPLMENVLQMNENGGARIQDTITTDDDNRPFTPGEDVWANQDVFVSLSCSSSFTSPEGSGRVSQIAWAGVRAGFWDVNGSSSVVIQNLLLRSEGRDQSISFVCRDTSGRIAIQRVKHINIDKTPPVLGFGGHVESVNASGWANTNLHFGWSCTDPLSGPVTPTVNAELSEGSNQSVTGTCEDNAGNSSFDTQTGFNIDTTPPTIAFRNRSPEPNMAGWNNSDVNLTWDCGDALSGPTALEMVVTLSVHAANQSAVGICSDLAGNSVTDTQTGINIDLIRPSITFQSRTPANIYGWNNDDVTVTWTCADQGSGPVVAEVRATISDEGKNQTATGTCSDRAGNEQSADQRDIHIDKTLPTMTFDRRTPANSHGWNNTDVTVIWICTDANLPTQERPVVLSADGANQTATAICSDPAANTATASETGINVDKTPPTITSVFPGTPTGWYGTNVTVSFHCTDSLSGVVSSDGGSQAVASEGPAQPATGTCEDNAGNMAKRTEFLNIDKTAPLVSCASPDGQWHNNNVTIACTASDALAGLSNSADSSFFLVTSVAIGTETGAAGTNSRSVCDRVGFCQAAGPISGSKVDRKAPTVICPVPPSFLINQAAAQVTATVTDGGSGPLVSTVSGAASTVAVGSFLISLTGKDVVQNTTTIACGYSVHGVESLNALVLTSSLTSKEQESLMANLENVAGVLDDGNPSNDAAACGKLGAFLNHLNALEQSRRLTAAEAIALGQEAQLLRALAHC
jgi:hypothetical protein